jgi:hypothetical protein
MVNTRVKKGVASLLKTEEWVTMRNVNAEKNRLEFGAARG